MNRISVYRSNLSHSPGPRNSRRDVLLNAPETDEGALRRLRLTIQWDLQAKKERETIQDSQIRRFRIDIRFTCFRKLSSLLSRSWLHCAPRRKRPDPCIVVRLEGSSSPSQDHHFLPTPTSRSCSLSLSSQNALFLCWLWDMSLVILTSSIPCFTTQIPKLIGSRICKRLKVSWTVPWTTWN